MNSAMDTVPIQFFQSIIAIELGITGALLFQIRYFAPPDKARREGEQLPGPALRLVVCVLLIGMFFGTLEAMVHGGDRRAAAALIVGLAASLLPILLRVLPPLRRAAGESRADARVAVVGVVVLVVTTAVAVILVYP
jgi:hypothetical protein